MALITGTLNKSVTPTSFALGLGDGALLFYIPTPPDIGESLGAATEFKFLTSTLNASVAPTLTGVGTGNNRGLLNESVRPDLTGVAENEYGRTGDFPDYSLPIIITLDAQGEGGTGTVVTGTLDASVTPSLIAGGLQAGDFSFFKGFAPQNLPELGAATTLQLITGVLDKPINIALTGEGHGPTLGVLDKSVNFLTLDGAGKGNNTGQLSENINFLTLSAAGLVYHGILNESINFLTLDGQGHGNNLSTLDADINLTLDGQANFEHDGTLSESIIITSNATGDVYHAFLDASVTPSLTGAGEAVTANQGQVDGFVTPNLTGVGHGPIEGILDESINNLTATALGQVIELIEGVLDESINFITLDGQGHGNNLGVLDESINNLTLDGVGKAFEIIDGVLNASVAPTLNGVGEVWHAALDASVTPTLTGLGVSQYGRLDASVNFLTLTSAGVVQYGRLDASVTPTLTGDGYYQAKYYGDMTLPAMESDPLNLMESDAKSAHLILPKLTIEAEASISNNAVVALTLPMLLLEAGDKGADITLPSLTIAAEMLSGRTANVNTTLPALQSTGQLDGDYSAAANLTLPALTATGNMIAGSGNTNVAVELPSLTILSSLGPGQLIEAALILPALECEAEMYSELFINADMTLPALRADAFIDNVGTLAVSTYSVNTENLELTEYSNYDFLSMAMFNGKPVGISATGIYELSGGDDAGTEIDASALFGFDDLGTAHMKRMFYAYLGYKSDGAVEVQISIDGEPAIRTYTVSKISGTTGIKRGRAKIAKGLRSRYWQVGVKNVAGSDLELDTLDLYIHETKRKVQ